MKDGAKALIYNPNIDKYLFVLRDNKPNIPNPNKWSLFGGGIESNENPEEALIREIKEEIGISINEIILLEDIPLIQVVQDKKFHISMHIYKVITTDKPKIFTEGQEFGWFTIDEILKKDIVPKLQDLITKYCSRLI